MKMKPLTTMAVTGLMVAGLTTAAWAAPLKMKMTTPIPESISTPDKLETSIGTLDFFDGVPTQETVDTTYDFLDKVHGMKTFLSFLPSMSVYQLREGQRSVGAENSNQICIYDTLMDSKSLVLTGNTSTMYALGFLDLKKDGPTVVELPEGMLGVFNDMAVQDKSGEAVSSRWHRLTADSLPKEITPIEILLTGIQSAAGVPERKSFLGGTPR